MLFKYKYELVCQGNTPTFGKRNVATFTNPVAVGDKVKKQDCGSNLLLVVSIEHYPSISVLYTEEVKTSDWVGFSQEQKADPDFLVKRN